MKHATIKVLALFALPCFLYSQQRVPAASFRPPVAPEAPLAGHSGGKQSANDPQAVAGGSSAVSADYVLGPGDVLTVSEADLDSSQVFYDKTFRIDNSGDVTIPLAGSIHAAGLTRVQAEAEVNKGLARVLKQPQAVIGVSEFHSQPVSVLGAVNNPGIIQVAGVRNLFEVLSLAGGIRQDAGNTIKITRKIQFGNVPLPDAQLDSTGQFSIASVRVKGVMSATDPSQNITIMPEDVITVPKGEVVYAVGALTKPGGFLLGENGALSTLQVISLAEGLSKTSAPNRAIILRVVPGSVSRVEIPVNVKQLMAGKAEDIAMRGDDILFIPTSGAKIASNQVLQALTAATGSAVLVATHF
jgi:polysaccharide export outer membrane protein